jgi:hypothetical protein
MTEKMYAVCHDCGEAFDDLNVAYDHHSTHNDFSILPESEAM